MRPKSLTKQEIDVAPQLIQLGDGDSHPGGTEGGAATDRRAKEEERSDADSCSDVSSTSVIQKILQRQNKSLRKGRRNSLTTAGIHRRTTNPSLHEHGAKRRRRRHNEGKAAHPELKAAQQLLQLSQTTSSSSSENNSETSHVTDACSAMETREELEINAARQIMRLSKEYSDNLKNEEESEEEEEEEERRSNLSSIVRKRVFVEECGRRKRKFRSLVDIYRKTKAL